jgi:lysophospholipase L1-like esterase
LLSSSHYPWLAVDPNTAGGATGGHMARCGRETRFGVSPWIRLRALAVLALCGVPFAGVHAVRPIRAQQEVLRASLSGGVALANGTRGGDDAGHPAVDARGKIACAEGDEPIELRWPEGWTRTTHEQRERALSPSFPGPDTDASETSDERDVITNALSSSSRRLLLKLAPVVLGEKDTLIVGAVGGSVTLGDTRRPDLAYPALFAKGLTEALANRAGEDKRKRDVSVAAVNGAMGGTGSGYFALCINRHLSMDADIVLVELNVNDGTDRSFERVHRKILDRASRPAVVDVLAEIWKEKMVEDREDSDASVTSAHPGFSREVVPGEQWRSRLETLKHYAVPYVSQAEAIAPEVSRDSKTFPDAGGAFAPDAFLRAADVAHIRNHTFTSAGLHLTTYGHGILAELLLHAVFRVVEHHAPDLCRGSLERALDEARDAESSLEALNGGRGVGGSLRGDVADRPGGVDSCHSPESLLAATVAGVEDSSLNKGDEEKGGWALAADASPNTGEKKWGVETSTPGAAWTVSLDTRVVRTRGGERDDPLIETTHDSGWAKGSVITVAYLASYENMGVAEGFCGGACFCAPFSINATWDKPTSELALFEVHTTPPTEDCRITLRMRPIEGNEGPVTRFKVLQMTVQEEFVEADRARAAMQEAGGAENAFRANRMTGGGGRWSRRVA